MHALHTASAPKVCMVMGGVHMNAVAALLPELGYHKIKTVGTDTLTSQECVDHVRLVDDLFSVNPLIPSTPDSWFSYVKLRIKRLFSKNIWANQCVTDDAKMVEFNKLMVKLAYANPIGKDDFGILMSHRDSVLPVSCDDVSNRTLV